MTLRRAGEAQPLPVPGPAARRTGCTSSARCSARSPSPTGSWSSRGRAGRGRLPRGRGPEPRERRAGRASRARLERPPAAGRDREADPGRRRARRRQRRRGGDPAPGGAARSRGSPSSPRGSAPTSPRSSTRPSRSSAGAGEVVEPLPPPGELRGGAGARRGAGSPRPRSTPRPTGSGSAATRAELERLAERLRAAAAAGASPLDYPELLVNDLETAALSLRPEIARGARRRWTRSGASARWSPAPGRRRSGCSRTSWRRDRAAAGCRRATRARSSPGRTERGASDPRRVAASAADGSRRAAAGDRGRGDRRLRGPQPAAARHRPPEALEDVSDAPRRLDLPAGRRSRLPRDGGVRRAGAPGRDGRHPRRRGRRPGGDLDRADDRDRLVRRLGRRLGQLPARAGGWAASSSSATGRGCGSRPSASPGSRSYFDAPRRQDDPDRPLHRAGARAGAVHRRQLGDALPRLPPVQHPRHGAVGGDASS